MSLNTTSLSTLVPGLGGGFDAPHVVYVSSGNTEGNDVGQTVQPPVAGLTSVKPVTESDVTDAVARNVRVDLDFEFQLAEQTKVVWKTIVLDGILYLIVDGTIPEGSKEAFVSLLEYAEEVLAAPKIVACFKRERTDRPLLIKTFMFLGFYPVPHGHCRSPGPDYIAMQYEIQ